VNPQNFFAELKRRKVFKVGAAYLVAAWLVVQAAAIGFPAFDAPSWVLRVFILVSLLGFPVAVVMAWILDVTPEGVRIDASASGSKRLFATATLLIVLALGWYFYGQPSIRKGDATTPAEPNRSVAALPIPQKSIAVLQAPASSSVVVLRLPAAVWRTYSGLSKTEVQDGRCETRGPLSISNRRRRV